MRTTLTFWAAAVFIGVSLTPSLGAAEQPQDFMLDAQPDGLFVLVDYLGSGGQLSIEHRQPIFGASNTLSTGASTLLAYPLGEVQARADLRMLFLELGGSLGYRVLWRNLTFEPGDHGEYCKDCDRTARREADPLFRTGPGSDRFFFGEARARFLAPFNENIVLVSIGALRYEDLRDRTYDWVFANIHDGGFNYRWETMLFFKHHDWGGIAPYLQVMSLPRGGHTETEVAYGFNAVTRMGLMRRDDLLFLTFLMRPHDPAYGQHAYHAPVRALLVYRMILEL